MVTRQIEQPTAGLFLPAVWVEVDVADRLLDAQLTVDNLLATTRVNGVYESCVFRGHGHVIEQWSCRVQSRYSSKELSCVFPEVSSGKPSHLRSKAEANDVDV